MDMVNLNIIESAMVAITREMGINVQKTAYSTIFSEAEDFTCALANPDGDPQGRITLEELTATDLASLVSFSTSGSASGSVTVAVSAFGGFVPTLSPTISFTTSDPFTPPTLTLGNFSEVRPFTSVNAS